MDTSNIKNLSKFIRSQIPFYMQQGDYETFIKFMELYYEWLSERNENLDVLTNILNYQDIDKTLDVFVDEFKFAFGSIFPDITKISESGKNYITGDSNLDNQYFEYDDFIGNGLTSSFVMSYREPSYYADNPNIENRVSEIKVYTETGLFVSENDRGTPDISGNSDIFSYYGFPTLYTTTLQPNIIELVENEDYYFEDGRLRILDISTGQIAIPTDQTPIRVLYRFSVSNDAVVSDIPKSKKTYFTNKKRFLKLMKEFYLSKGTEKSYEFLFRSFFNKDISFYYPKEYLLKPSNNEWVVERSIRTIPSTSVFDDPVFVIGVSSGATANVENFSSFFVSTYPVREYFLNNITGDFQDKEFVQIYTKSGLIVKEQLYTCVTGFNIINGGTNYPRNIVLQNFIADTGSGAGFSAKIKNTTIGGVDSVGITDGGSGYMTGEHISFSEYGTYGYGAKGIVEKVSTPVTSFTERFVQVDEDNVLYPIQYWDLTEDYETYYSRNETVYLEVPDNNYDNVVLLTDFSSLSTTTQFEEYKNQLSNYRYNASFDSIVYAVTKIDENDGSYLDIIDLPPKVGERLISFDNGYVTFSGAFKKFNELADGNDTPITIDFWFRPSPDSTSAMDLMTIWEPIFDENSALNGINKYFKIYVSAPEKDENGDHTGDGCNVSMDIMDITNNNSISTETGPNNLKYYYQTYGTPEGQVDPSDNTPHFKNWTNITLVIGNDFKLYINGILHIDNSFSAYYTFSDSCNLTIGSNVTYTSEISYNGDKLYFDSLRMTAADRTIGRTQSDYLSITNTYYKDWFLTPIPFKLEIPNVSESGYKDSEYYWGLTPQKKLYFKKRVVSDVDPTIPEEWDSILDGTEPIDALDGNIDGATIYSALFERTLANVSLPLGYVATIEWQNLPRGGISKIKMITHGDGYSFEPIPYVETVSDSYTSRGFGASLYSIGSNIGSIQKIDIFDDSDYFSEHGFGVGYDTPPTIDLSEVGNGDAEVEVVTGPLCIRNGRYKNRQGFLSDEIKLQDSYLWQDYSYVIRVSKAIDEWREIVKKVVHPAGLMMFGEISLETTAAKSTSRYSISYTALIYEILKNVDISVKVMDGLGKWTGSKIVDESGVIVNYTTPVSTTNTLSHGIITKYNSRHETVNEIYTTSNTGYGRYCLLSEDGTTIPYFFNDVSYVVLNNYDKYKKDYSNFYSGEMVGRTFVLYDTSDEVLSSPEFANTRPHGKYEVVSVEHDYANNVTKFVVKYLFSNNNSVLPTNLSTLNNVEFRWDKRYTGNIDRKDSNWVGSIADGASPKDDKFILWIAPRESILVGNSYKSLERYKFNLTGYYPTNELSRYRFSPMSEAINSPLFDLMNVYGSQDVSKDYDSGLITLMQTGVDDYSYIVIPSFVDSYSGVTDIRDHTFERETIQSIVDSYNTRYNATTDSSITLYPKHMFISKDDTGVDGTLKLGPNWKSLERIKFTYSAQILDNNLNEQSTENVEINYKERTNISSESSIYTYNDSPVTIEEYNSLNQI